MRSTNKTKLFGHCNFFCSRTSETICAPHSKRQRNMRSQSHEHNRRSSSRHYDHKNQDTTKQKTINSDISIICIAPHYTQLKDEIATRWCKGKRHNCLSDLFGFFFWRLSIMRLQDIWELCSLRLFPIPTLANNIFIGWQKGFDQRHPRERSSTVRLLGRWKNGFGLQFTSSFFCYFKNASCLMQRNWTTSVSSC